MNIHDCRFKQPPATIAIGAIATGTLFDGVICNQGSIYLKTYAGIVNLRTPSVVWTSPDTVVFNYAIITDHELIIRK